MKIKLTIIFFIMTGLMVTCNIAKAQALDDTQTVLNVTCNGGSDGSIDLSVTGGLPPYTFNWSNGNITEDISGLFAGTYTVTISDNVGSTLTSAIAIAQPPALIALIDSFTNVSCSGTNDAAIYSSATGGVAPYNFLWNNSAITSGNTGLTAGSYTLIVTDANGCSGSVSQSVSSNSGFSINCTGPTLLCEGTCRTLTATSNDPNNNYSWSPGGSGNLNTLSGPVVIACPLATTTYYVTALDVITGCTATASITLTFVALPQPKIVENDTSICDDGNCHYLHVIDTGAYSSGYPAGTLFEWINYTAPTVGLDSLCVIQSDCHTVVVTLPPSYGGCSDTSNTVCITFIPNPFVLLTDSECCINSQVFLGTPAYSYSWSSSAIAPGICPGISGTYTVTVTDVNGCSGTASYNLICPCTVLSDDYNANTNWTQVGTRVVIGGSRVNFNSLRGSSDDSRIFIPLATLGNHWKSEFEFFADTNNFDNNNFNEAANAGVAVNLFCLSSNNLTPYVIFPFGGLNYTNQNFINVNLQSPNGSFPNYKALTTINVSCKVGATSEVTPVTLSLPSWNTVYYVRLERQSDLCGSISVYSDAARTIHIAGSPHCFAIPQGLTGLNTLQHSNIDQADDLRRFTGWVDSALIDTCFQPTTCNLCTWTGCIKFKTALSTLSAIPDVTSTPCTYTYIWTITTSNSTISFLGKDWPNVPPFTCVTLKVMSCCGDSTILTYCHLTNPLLTKTDPCCNDSDGVITASNISGGSQPCVGYNITWQKSSNGLAPWMTVQSGYNTQLLDCKAGMWYRAIISDCCGNTITSAKIKMGVYKPFAITTKKTASDCLIYNGTVTFNVTSTCAPITYSYTYIPFPNCSTCLPPAMSFSEQPLPNPPVIGNLAPGNYTYFIQRCGVTYTLSIVIHFKKPTIKFHFTNCNGNVCIETSACCNPTFTWLKNGLPYGNQTQCRVIGPGPNQLRIGTTYTAKVTDCEGQTVSRSIKIPAVTSSITNASCAINNGQICLQVAGWMPVQYSWIGINGPWSANNCLNNAAPGNHCAWIKNSAGDIWECCYSVINISPPVTFTEVNESCRETCIDVMTGTPFTQGNSYLIHWTPCGTNIAIPANCIDECGCYNVGVTDAAGCTASQQVNIAGVKINQTSNCALCADMCGTCLPYSYEWSTSAISSCISCVDPGTYTVTVTDCNGVTYTCSKSINPIAMQCQITALLPEIQITLTGGCPSYHCTWQKNNIPQPSCPPGLNEPTVFSFPNPGTNDTYNMVFTDDCNHACIPFQFNAKIANGTILNFDNPILAPNPNNGNFSVYFNSDWLDKNVEYSVFDVAGKVVKTDKLVVKDSNPVQFDLIGKPKGIYMIMFHSGSNYWKAKFIIQ